MHNVTTINIIALENNSTINENIPAVKLGCFFVPSGLLLTCEQGYDAACRRAPVAHDYSVYC